MDIEIANELREGNWVYESSTDQIKKICIIMNESNYGGFIKDGIGFYSTYPEINMVSNTSWIYPIKLTEQILSESGFSFNDLNGESGFWQIITENGIFQILSGEEGFTIDFKTKIEYVHQLQNACLDEKGHKLNIVLVPET